jgi:uridylate kinase
MDMTAIALCRDNHLPIIVFNLRDPQNVQRVVLGEPIGTLVEEGEPSDSEIGEGRPWSTTS